MVPAAYERHRYVLELRLADAPDARNLAVLMKNPSTATAERLDPTIGKVQAWARRHDFGGVTVVNLFALRATHPRALNAYPYEVIVGPENDQHIGEVAARADVIALGWGNPNGLALDRYARRTAEVQELLAPYPLHVVGPLTHFGHPRHGLRWNGGMELARWDVQWRSGGVQGGGNGLLRRERGALCPCRVERLRAQGFPHGLDRVIDRGLQVQGASRAAGAAQGLGRAE